MINIKRIDVDSALRSLTCPDDELWDAAASGDRVPEVDAYIADALTLLRAAYPTSRWIEPGDVSKLSGGAPINVVDRDGVVCIVGFDPDDEGVEEFERREVRYRNGLCTLTSSVGDVFDEEFYRSEHFPYRVYSIVVDGDMQRVTKDIVHRDNPATLIRTVVQSSL